MRVMHFVAMLTFLFCLTTYAGDGFSNCKTWTDQKGRTVCAKIFVCEPKYSEPSLDDVLTLEKPDNSQKKILVNELSYEDQQYVLGNIKDAINEWGFHLWEPTLRNESAGNMKRASGEDLPAPGDRHTDNIFFSREEVERMKAQASSVSDSPRDSRDPISRADYQSPHAHEDESWAFLYVGLGIIATLLILTTRKHKLKSAEDRALTDSQIPTSPQRTKVKWHIRIPLWIIWFIIWSILLAVGSYYLNEMRQQAVADVMQSNKSAMSLQVVAGAKAVFYSIELLLLLLGYKAINKTTKYVVADIPIQCAHKENKFTRIRAASNISQKIIVGALVPVIVIMITYGMIGNIGRYAPLDIVEYWWCWTLALIVAGAFEYFWLKSD